MELNDALEIANIAKAKLAPHCYKIEIAGSIRREKDKVKDIELVCIPRLINDDRQRNRRTAKWCAAVYGLGKITKGKIKDGLYLKINLGEIMLDLFIAEPENWGMKYLIRTGSKEFSQHILAQFKKLGYKSEACYPTKGEERLEFSTEQEIFDYLGVPYVYPNQRDDLKELLPF